MYVNPFWFGVLVTVVIEVVAILIAATVAYRKENKK